MEFKIRETGEIKEVCYVAEVEDLLPALVESDDDAKFTGDTGDDLRYEISQNGFEWWEEWADEMQKAMNRFIDLVPGGANLPMPEEFVANELEDEPTMLNAFCDAIETDGWEFNHRDWIWEHK